MLFLFSLPVLSVSVSFSVSVEETEAQKQSRSRRRAFRSQLSIRGGGGGIHALMPLHSTVLFSALACPLILFLVRACCNCPPSTRTHAEGIGCRLGTPRGSLPPLLPPLLSSSSSFSSCSRLSPSTSACLLPPPACRLPLSALVAPLALNDSNECRWSALHPYYTPFPRSSAANRSPFVYTTTDCTLMALSKSKPCL